MPSTLLEVASPKKVQMVSQEISARDRAFVNSYSSIFDEGGPTTNSTYDKEYQNELLKKQKQNVNQPFEPQ